MKLRSLTVGDLMSTALLVMREHDSVEQAEFEMRMAGIRHIPVIDDRRHLLGILSNRDLLRCAGRSRNRVPLAEVMTRKVLTVAADTPAHEAAHLMLTHKIGALPVLGEDGQLVGIVTETDFMRVAWKSLGGAEPD